MSRNNEGNRREFLKQIGKEVGVPVLAVVGAGATVGALNVGLHAASNQKIRNAINALPVNVLTGRSPAPDVSSDELAKLLAHNPAARERWDEAKAFMAEVEAKAAAIMKQEGKSQPWTKRARKPEVREL